MSFDAAYFSGGLLRQIRGLAGAPVVRLVLHDGREFLVRSIQEAAPGYLALEIYAPQGPSRGSFAFPPATALIDLPTYPSAIAYEAIAQVLLQAATPEHGTRIGFQAERAEA